MSDPAISPEDPTTESEGFRAYKAGRVAERERILGIVNDYRQRFPRAGLDWLVVELGGTP